MKLKIIGGVFGGRMISAPQSQHTRPTSSRVRETVFNILQDNIEGATFLDMFAGSGAMGIEALSRGAEHTTFVEKQKTAIQTIQSNIKALNIEKKTTLIKQDCYSCTSKLQPFAPFDIIYLDPPYPKTSRDLQPLEQLLLLLEREKIVGEASKIFFELPSRFAMISLGDCTHLKVVNQRKMGDTILVEIAYE